MRELDRLLSGFLEHQFTKLSDAEIESFEAVLELPDPELYGYLLGRATPASPQIGALIQRIRDHGGGPA
jgi:antitoxin CptB